MKITVTRTITKEVELHTQKADVVVSAIHDLFNDMCDKRYEEYIKMLRKLKPLVDECHRDLS
jgi:5,10-methylene-tetrahydrofolate dehydrogenase/methenyl tetrahydrofolate cyclohydrolase